MNDTHPHGTLTLQPFPCASAEPLERDLNDCQAVKQAIGVLRRRWIGRDAMARLRHLADVDPEADAWDLDDADRVAVLEARRELAAVWGRHFDARLDWLGCVALCQEAGVKGGAA